MDLTTTSSRNFDSLNLSAETLASLDAMGYKGPTDVQFETIPRAQAGKDLVVQSRTGTGKTAAFGIPMIEKVDPGTAAVQAVALAPTRELAIQVAEELAQIGKAKGVRIETIYGGDSMDRQLEGIRAGAHVIVGTPGRVLDHLRRKTLRFDQVKLLVLDEADRMLDMGFAVEMGQIMEYMPAQRQSLLFSATIPLGIKGLIYHYLTDPEWVLLSEDQIYVKEVEHTYVLTPKMHKEAMIYKLIEYENPASSMIFCNTKEEVRQVATFLLQGPARGHALLRPAPEEAREGDGQLSHGRDPPSGDDRRRLARDRHRGPLARLHLLHSRLARAVHPPRRPHGPGRQERARHQPHLRPRPHELQPAREALSRRGDGADRALGRRGAGAQGGADGDPAGRRGSDPAPGGLRRVRSRGAPDPRARAS